jgi:hypothetical protein
LDHSGDAAASLFPVFKRIIVVCLRSAEEKFKNGSKLLSKLLRAFSSVYPINYGPHAGAGFFSDITLDKRQ